MRSDLTCPVEIIGVDIVRVEQKEQQERVACAIRFANLADRHVSSIQMNIRCFDVGGVRLGGRLVRAAVSAEPFSDFSGEFIPEHVSGVARVEASVEKIWYQDGMLWRREERNVFAYESNLLPQGRELDRLRAVAGSDARGYAREDDAVWMCVCGRANRNSEGTCMRCGRERAQVLEQFTFEAVDGTAGRKERDLQAKSLEAAQRSSAQSAYHAQQERKKRRRTQLRLGVAILGLALLALGLFGYHVIAPIAILRVADRASAEGKAANAKQLYTLVANRWPQRTEAGGKALEAEKAIIDRMIEEGTIDALRQAMERASALPDEVRRQKSALTLALALDASGDAEGAEALLRTLAGNRQAELTLCRLVYRIAEEAKERLEYPEAIGRFASLGDYEDAQAQREDCLYLYGRQLLREGKYREAEDQLSQAIALADAAALLRQARYRRAEQLAKGGEALEAAQLYESLGDYEESVERALAARYAAGMRALGAQDLAGAAEQFALAEDHRDAAAQFELAAGQLADEALARSDWPTAIGWLSRKERTPEVQALLSRAIYQGAEALLSEGRREEAAVEFASLGDYADAKERASAIRYALAIQEMESAPEAALARFEELGAYRDAREKAQECRWRWARSLEESGAYARAIEVYGTIGEADANQAAVRCRYLLAGERMNEGAYHDAALLYAQCGDYPGAQEAVQRARYAEASALEADGNYPEAAAAFAALGSYLDAKQAATRCEDVWLKEPTRSAQMDLELGNYRGAIEGLEGLLGAQFPKRYAQLPQLYEQACLGLAQELIGLGKPLDALPYLERIPENKTAQKRLQGYVYRIIGRWKQTRGTEFVFRRDGTCRIAGQEGYFGGNGYEIAVGSEPYPQTGAYTVVSLRGSVLTLRDLAIGKNLRLNYLGEPTTPGEEPTDEMDEDQKTPQTEDVGEAKEEP